MSVQVNSSIESALERDMSRRGEDLRARLAAAAEQLEALSRELASWTANSDNDAWVKIPNCKTELGRIGAATAEVTDMMSAMTAADGKPTATPSFTTPSPLALLSDFSQRLTLIRGLDAHAAATLNNLGIHTFADIAALTSEDVREIARLLGDRRRISREGWIEQAEILAGGSETFYAARVLDGDMAAVVAAPITQPMLPARPESAATTATVIPLVIPLAAARQTPAAVARPRIRRYHQDHRTRRIGSTVSHDCSGRPGSRVRIHQLDQGPLPAPQRGGLDPLRRCAAAVIGRST
jgi:predicted flap endonuclease-1-like 5' DNA nuclease